MIHFAGQRDERTRPKLIAVGLLRIAVQALLKYTHDFTYASEYQVGLRRTTDYTRMTHGLWASVNGDTWTAVQKVETSIHTMKIKKLPRASPFEVSQTRNHC